MIFINKTENILNINMIFTNITAIFFEYHIDILKNPILF